MRICDCSSYVCSSDPPLFVLDPPGRAAAVALMALPFAAWLLYLSAHAPAKPRTCTCGEPRLPVLPWQGLRPEDRRRKEKPRPAEAGRGERGRGNIGGRSEGSREGTGWSRT